MLGSGEPSHDFPGKFDTSPREVPEVLCFRAFVAFSAFPREMKNRRETAGNRRWRVSVTPAFAAGESRQVSQSYKSAVKRTLAAESSRPPR